MINWKTTKPKGSKIPNFEEEVEKLRELKGLSKSTAQYYVYIIHSNKPRNKRIVQIMKEESCSITKARRLERQEYEESLKEKIENDTFKTNSKLDIIFESILKKRDNLTKDRVVESFNSEFKEYCDKVLKGE